MKPPLTSFTAQRVVLDGSAPKTPAPTAPAMNPATT
jgi:hypothetical protein